MAPGNPNQCATAARGLGLWSCVALVVASMVGAGVFTTSGFTLADLRSREWVLAAWAIGGVLALSGALCYAALARRFPASGGEYEYLRRTVHPLAGALAGWVSLCAGFTAPLAAAARALDPYMAAAFDVESTGRWCGTAAIAAAGLAHGTHVRSGAVVQNLVVAVKVALMATLVVGGGVAILARGAPPPIPAADGGAAFVPALAVSLVWISFAYSGWNAAVYVAGEVRTPERTVARALLVGTLLVTALYLGLNAVFVYADDFAALAGRPEIAAAAAEGLAGPWLRRAVGGLVALALVTSITSLVMAGPRVYARMAEDGVLPGWFAARDARPPRAAITLQCALALVALWVARLEQLMTYVGWTLSVCSALTVLGLCRVRAREGAAAVPVRGWPWLPAFYVIAVLGIAGFSLADRPVEGVVGLATLGAGVGLGWWFLRSRAD
ncbi:MAG: amino acid permease [Planctomycetes bacterium]|nr:amino acid permease [Planctomycetota bacterium]